MFLTTDVIKPIKKKQNPEKQSGRCKKKDQAEYKT